MANSSASPTPSRPPWAWRSPPVLLAATLILFGLAKLPESASGFAVRVSTGPVLTVQQFRETADGSFEVTAVNGKLKCLLRKLTLTKNTEYHIRYDITRISGSGMVVTDFIGTNYDNMEQEFHLNLSSADAPLHVDRSVNSGNPPSDAYLRIMSEAPILFAVRNVEVTGEGNPLLHALRWLLLALGSISAVALVVQSCRTYASGFVAGIAGVRERLVDPVWALAAAILLVTSIGLAVMVRNLALGHPFVFGDEGIFIILARYLGRFDLLRSNGLVFTIPGTLYLASIHWIFRLGANYVAGARLMNVIWLGVGLLLIYGTARQFMKTPWALLAVAAIGAGPISIYAACVMPETMYFCAICGVFFVFVRYIGERPLLAAALAGFLLGAASLVKPHALVIVVPAILALVLLKASFPEWSSWKTCALQIVAVLAFIYVAQNIINLAFTGHAGFDLGSTYTGQVKQSAQTSRWMAFLYVYAGHAAMLLSLYAAPLIVVAMGLSRRRLLEEPLAAAVRLRGMLLLLTCCLFTLLLTTTQFGVTMAGHGSFEPLGRLHGRYYFFMLPFLIVSFFAVATRLDWRQPRVRTIFGVACGVAGVLAVLLLLLFDRRYFMYFIDYPEVFWFIKGDRSNLAFPLIGTSIPLFVYAFRRSCPPAWFGIGYLAVSLAGTVSMSRYLLELPPTSADTASALFRNLIPEAEWDSGLVIVTESGDVDPYRLLFHLPAAYELVLDPTSSVIPADAVASDRAWVLVTSDRPVQFTYAESFASGRYHLYLRKPSVQVSQTTVPPQAAQIAPSSLGSGSGDACAVDHMVGFQARENWGVWTAQDPAEIDLLKPVSGKIRLRLVVYGLAKNPSRTLQIAIGDSVKSITLPAEPGSFDLDYDLRSASQTIVFRGIAPRSPRALGVADDNRQLGVGLVKLECSKVQP